MPDSSRIAVVGAGIIGSAIAETLAGRGARVTLYDMRRPGAGASQASAGVLCPFVEAKPGSALLTLGTRSLDIWDSWVGQIRSRTSVPFHYERSGTLEVAFGADEATHLKSASVWLTAEGVAHEWLHGAALREREPQISVSAEAGLLIKSHGFVQVSALIAALIDSARQHGAICETPTEILHVEQKGEVVRVRAANQPASESLEVDHVVIAAGPWSRRVRVAGAPVFEVRPVRGQLLHLKWPDASLPARSVWGTRCYTVPWPDGSLLVGATVEDVGFDERSTVAGVRDLLDAAGELLPAAWQASLESVRVGLRPATADHLPLIGPLDRHPRITLATGHYRNGVLLAPYTADVVSRLILDNTRDPMLDLTRPERLLAWP
ncbi:MAG TPA: glycine oxidase ThiO [Vicinamibacterales bacterium]|nr:glycine oxidase ThiO [Vicinamibacterales bacterium]